MSLPVILRPEAENDVRAIHEQLETTRFGLGDQFAELLRRSFTTIEAMPELFGIVWQDVRAVRIRRFHYLIYYQVKTDQVEVLAVLHSSQSAENWQGRV